MGVLDDWGRPPILIENNNNGQQVLDVLCHTHNYESVISYHFDGVSKHYNKENRFGIHNHTNTRYRGVTNFRYWTNGLRAVSLFDMETLLELTNFVQHENFTYSKRKESDMDDRVFALIWALFILDPSIAIKYYNIIETDDQGRPLKIKPLVDNSDLIKKSPLSYGQVSAFKKNPIINNAYSFVGRFDENKPISIDEETSNFKNWLSELWEKPKTEEKPTENKELNGKFLNGEEYRPTVLI